MRKYIIFKFSLKSVTERTLLNQSRHFSLCTMAMEYACTDIKPHSNYNVNYTILCVCVCVVSNTKNFQMQINAKIHILIFLHTFLYRHILYLKVLTTKKECLNISLLQNKIFFLFFSQQLGICCHTIRGKVSH